MAYRWCVVWNSVLLVLFSNLFLIAFILPLDIISNLPLNLDILHFNCIANPCFEIHFHKRSSIITTSEVSVYFLVELLSSQILGIVLLHFSYLFEYYISIFNNISVLSWWSALSVEETRVPRENHSTSTSTLVFRKESSDSSHECIILDVIHHVLIQNICTCAA
jgi:hypothetical protein